MAYSMTCSCGQVVTSDEITRNAAVEDILNQMGQDFEGHLAENHQGEPPITLEQMRDGVETNIQEDPSA